LKGTADQRQNDAASEPSLQRLASAADVRRQLM
jgi:hypothetical protein